MSEMSVPGGRIALTSLDSWIDRSAEWVEIVAGDIAHAGSYLRRLDLPLLAPDAIHIAIAQRLGATLVTFDRQMSANARALGCSVELP